MLGRKHGSIYYMFSFFVQTCMAHLSVVNLSSFTPQKKLLTWGLLSIFFIFVVSIAHLNCQLVQLESVSATCKKGSLFLEMPTTFRYVHCCLSLFRYDSEIVGNAVINLCAYLCKCTLHAAVLLREKLLAVVLLRISMLELYY